MRTKCLNFQLQRIRYNYRDRRLLCKIDGENIYQIPQKKEILRTLSIPIDPLETDIGKDKEQLEGRKQKLKLTGAGISDLVAEICAIGSLIKIVHGRCKQPLFCYLHLYI